MVVDNKATISYISVLKEDLSIFHIKPNEGQVPDFKPGQFVTLGVNVPSEGKIVRRAYSIASPPQQKKHFELIIRWVKKPSSGRLTTQMFDKKGNDISYNEPTRNFTLPEFFNWKNIYRINKLTIWNYTVLESVLSNIIRNKTKVWIKFVKYLVRLKNPLCPSNSWHTLFKINQLSIFENEFFTSKLLSAYRKVIVKV